MIRVRLVLLILLLPRVAFAGELYGSLTEGKMSVGEGVQVEIQCAETAYPPTATDKYGSYRLYVQARGKCLLTVHYKQQSPAIGVSSYERSVRYDLVLEKNDGQYSLRRK